MQSESEKRAEPVVVPPPVQTESKGDRPARPIAELLVLPDFPKSALGELVDIGGYTGVVVEIVHQSLKVKSGEGVTKSFNAGGLRKLYGPRVLPEPYPQGMSSPSVSRQESVSEPAPAPPPKRDVITNPDFSKPVKKIAELVHRPDYPKCLLGEYIEIAGFSGVVVEIASRSLKVRSPAETTRSYNADAIRRLYS